MILQKQWFPQLLPFWSNSIRSCRAYFVLLLPSLIKFFFNHEVASICKLRENLAWSFRYFGSSDNLAPNSSEANTIIHSAALHLYQLSSCRKKNVILGGFVTKSRGWTQTQTGIFKRVCCLWPVYNSCFWRTQKRVKSRSSKTLPPPAPFEPVSSSCS